MGDKSASRIVKIADVTVDYSESVTRVIEVYVDALFE